MQKPHQQNPQNLLSSLRNNKKGATLLELMMMLMVVSLALLTMFTTLTQSITFARETEARVKATALAREGIEAMINIRNTNWLRFSSNRADCWDVLNYNKNCITNNSTQKINNWKYQLFSENWLWKLSPINNDAPTPIYIDEDGWFVGKWEDTQTTPTETCKNINDAKKCKTTFSRTIEIKNKADANGANPTAKMTVFSTVYWTSGNNEKKVTLSMDLTNWKANYSQ